MNTQIEISARELKSVLPGFAKIVSRSSPLPVLQCLKASLDPEGKNISLQAHSLDEVATVRIRNQAQGLPGEMLVPWEVLARIAKNGTPEKPVRLIGTGDETWVRYAVGGSYVDRMVTRIPVRDWPHARSLDRQPIRVDERFKAALREALEFASTDSSRRVLTGAYVDVQDKNAHYIVGTDGRVLYAANSFQFDLPESLIVPARKFLSWPGFINDGAWNLRTSPSVRARSSDEQPKEEPPWLQIDSDNWTYAVKAMDGPFPNWKPVVPEDTGDWSRIALQPTSIRMMIDAVPLLPGAEDEGQPIVLVAGEALVLHAKARDQAQSTQLAVPDAAVVGKPVQVCVNRNYLLKALRVGFSRIDIHDSLSPLVFSGTGKTMVVMPLRLPQHASEAASEPHTAPATPPSVAESQPQTVKKNTMPTTTITKPERGNLPPENHNGEAAAKETRTAFKAALENLDTIRTNLREVIGDLSEVVSLLKTAEKEQRVSARELEAVRAKLREIQSVAI